MGLFDLFKKKDTANAAVQAKPEKQPVLKEEKTLYQPDSYYTDIVSEGTAFEHRVITFDERKKTAIPSSRGLYPAEILLLDYCSKGTYPNPKNGYPGFWWFEYGIRYVEIVLNSLEERGYIVFASAKESVKGLTVQQLKKLLADKGCPTTGKKAELIARIADVITEEGLLAAGVQAKYTLTEIGQQELNENAYVPYMHRAHNKTIEDDRLGIMFNVWSINKLLGAGDKSNWKAVVESEERKMNREITSRNDALMKDLKKVDPKAYKEIRTQEQQITAINNARDRYSEDKDLDSYITFWESIWANGGLKFEGVGWHFELPNLYIKAKRYDDALAFVIKLKASKSAYAYKADTYIKKIEQLKAKCAAKK